MRHYLESSVSKKLVLLFGISIGFLGTTYSQERCATVAYQKVRDLQNPKIETTPQFENWMGLKLKEPKTKTFGTQGTEAATYTIPVVFHIIHNGEPLGTGTNIPDAQVVSQVKVLNDDFKRLNADASQTPPEFLSAAGSLDIEFVLAKQNPEGLATDGIQRVQGTQTEWTLANNSEFKALSYWPSEDYLNIWIINFNDPNNFIGYAQLPQSTLPGLENSSSDALTDGVVINFKDVGSIDDGPFDLDPEFNKGRTGTHEVGHFFGLRHIWGDGSSCSATDFVDDTPSQSSPTNGCPSHPQVNCSANKMFQNYLDYTNDACMNLFTQDQIARMEVVLQNSPRRASLTTSVGSMDPAPVPDDLGIREITNPKITSCGGDVIPSIEIRNYGSNQITSAQIEFKKDGISQEIKNLVLNLSPLDITTVAFNSVNLPSPSSSTLTFEILLTNGNTDGKASDNLATVDTSIPFISSVPFFEIFNSIPTNWSVQNPDLLRTWESITAPNSSPTNTAAYINFYDYEEQGVLDRLISPVLDLSGETAALLKFDIAYAQFPGNSFDELNVVITTDCSSDFSNGVDVFNKSGADLATTASTSNSFKPSAQSQWKTETISLTPFIGEQNLQVAFIGQNGFGNNIYLDNVFVLTGDFTDAAIVEIVSPSPVINTTNPTPTLRINNVGSIPITEFKIETLVNSELVATKAFNGLTLLTGEELTLMLDPITLNTGTNEIIFTLKEPNAIPDDAPANNEMTLTVVVNESKESIPARQNFNLSFQDTWTIVSQESQRPWEVTTTNKGSSLVYRAFNNTSKGDEAWLVSPTLDFSNAIKASLFFDLSYKVSFNGTDRLRILSSTDGGLTFSGTQFDRAGNTFSLGSSTEAWVPASDEDWAREFVNLNDLVGEENVRLAFVATNDNGNNMYLDEIELFNDDNPAPPSTTSLFSVYTTSFLETKITFNLPEKEQVRLQVYNTMGQVVLDNELHDTLNQTYTLDLSNQRAGIYIIRVHTRNEVKSTKVFISR